MLKQERWEVERPEISWRWSCQTLLAVPVGRHQVTKKSWQFSRNTSLSCEVECSSQFFQVWRWQPLSMISYRLCCPGTAESSDKLACYTCFTLLIVSFTLCGRQIVSTLGSCFLKTDFYMPGVPGISRTTSALSRSNSTVAEFFRTHSQATCVVHDWLPARGRRSWRTGLGDEGAANPKVFKPKILDWIDLQHFLAPFILYYAGE